VLRGYETATRREGATPGEASRRPPWIAALQGPSPGVCRVSGMGSGMGRMDDPMSVGWAASRHAGRCKSYQVDGHGGPVCVRAWRGGRRCTGARRCREGGQGRRFVTMFAGSSWDICDVAWPGLDGGRRANTGTRSRATCGGKVIAADMDRHAPRGSVLLSTSSGIFVRKSGKS
jgi:hypothetical protein